MLDRVLGREHEERPLEPARQALARHLVLLHRLEQRRLRLRRGAVDLVGEEEVREDRPGAELEVGGALVVDRRAGHVGGHQVGRELDPAEAQSGRLREGARHQRLGQAGEILDQDVAVGEQAEQDELERLTLADDRALDLVEQPGRAVGDLGDLHKRFDGVDDDGDLVERQTRRVVVARPRPVGADEVPGLRAEQRLGGPRGRVEVDSPQPEARRGHAAHRRAQPVVGVECGLGRQPDLALELGELARLRLPDAAGRAQRRGGWAARGAGRRACGAIASSRPSVPTTSSQTSTASAASPGKNAIAIPSPSVATTTRKTNVGRRIRTRSAVRPAATRARRSPRPSWRRRSRAG